MGKNCENGHSHKCKQDDKYDYVIVGAGTGGSILAAMLSDPDEYGNFKNSVCVLEAGINLTQDPVVLANNLYAASVMNTNPKYALRTPATSFDSIQYNQSEGIMWGGSSGHNGLQLYRATPDIYDQWAAISGDNRWLYNNLLNNVMIPMEHYTPDGTVANPAQRGFNGNLFVTQAPSVLTDPASQALATASGAGFSSDLNDIAALTNGQVGVGANQVSATPLLSDPSSIRSFGGNSFLTGIPSRGIPAIVGTDGNGLNGRKLKIISGAHANRIIISQCHGKKRAKGVEYTVGDDRDKTLIVKARKAVISCCGALYTPVLFQLSGIGDAALLNSLDIPVVLDNKNVGAHLSNHTGGFGFIANLPSTINPPYIGNAFIGLPDAPDTRTIQVLYGNGDVLRFFVPQSVRTFVDLPDGGSGYIFLSLNPKSEGTVKIVANDPFRQPLVQFNNYSDGGPSDPGSDANKVVEFYRLLLSVAVEGGGSVAYPTSVQYADGDDALLNAALITPIDAFHQSGSCRMGTSKADGVVDGNLKVFEIDGLYVGDNAAAPVISDANTCLQAYIIGAELARILRQ